MAERRRRERPDGGGCAPSHDGEAGKAGGRLGRAPELGRLAAHARERLGALARALNSRDGAFLCLVLLTLLMHLAPPRGVPAAEAGQAARHHGKHGAHRAAQVVRERSAAVVQSASIIYGDDVLDTAMEDASLWEPEPADADVNGAQLLDLATIRVTRRCKGQACHAPPAETSALPSPSWAGTRASTARPVADIGVLGGVLPRGEHLAWLDRIAREPGKPVMRYMHMAAVAKIGDRFVAAWQASAEHEGNADQRIWHTFSLAPGGKKWGPHRKIPTMEAAAPQWSPVLHVDHGTGRLLLFYSESEGCVRPPPPAAPDAPMLHPTYGERWLPGGNIKMTSLQVGEPWQVGQNYSWLRAVKWSAPRTLLQQGHGQQAVPKVIANPLIELLSGEWLLPFWQEPHDAPPYCEKHTHGTAGVLRSRDRGLHWKAFGNITHPKTWLIENTLAERSDGSVLMFFRSKVGTLFQSISYDKGRSWTDPVATAIPNPDSYGCQAEKRPDGVAPASPRARRRHLAR